MNEKSNSKLTHKGQILRKRMTPEEKRLWIDFLKKLPVNVNRQKVIGRYIVDFYIASSKLAIEVDGSQHFEDVGRRKDFERDRYLSEIGIKVLRYTNRDVKNNFYGVCGDILKNIRSSSHLSP